jgi:hypothetical protein
MDEQANQINVNKVEFYTADISQYEEGQTVSVSANFSATVSRLNPDPNGAGKVELKPTFPDPQPKGLPITIT